MKIRDKTPVRIAYLLADLTLLFLVLVGGVGFVAPALVSAQDSFLVLLGLLSVPFTVGVAAGIIGYLLVPNLEDLLKGKKS